MAIDFASNIGRVRLRVADISDLPLLPDSVYTQYIADNDGNLVNAAKDVACVILGILSFKTHRKLAQLEVWGAESFSNYKEFLILTVSNPAFMNISPIPYSGSGKQLHPLIQFASDWNRNYDVTQSQQLAFDAVIGPNDGSLYGILGLGTNPA